MKNTLQSAVANLQIIFCIFALSVLAAGAVDVQFNFGDFTSKPAAVKRLTLYPVSIDSSNNVQLITGDRVIATTTTNGAALFTNVLCGTYRSELFGASVTTTNLFNFPCTNGVINAKDWQIKGVGFLLWEEAGVSGGRITFEL